MSTMINVRVDNKLKRDSKKVLDELGLGFTDAIKIYLKSIVRNNGIPFSLEIPNEETLEAFKEVQDDMNGKKKLKAYDSVEELWKDLGL